MEQHNPLARLFSGRMIAEAVKVISEGSMVGLLHTPVVEPIGSLVLTHGAGANCQAPLLAAVAEELASAGLFVLRYDLPFRQRRRSGPPSQTTAAEDRAGLRAAAEWMKQMQGGPVYLGGHSYGGRQASMAAAEAPNLTERLLLLSYPLHPPGKPAQLRTGHFGDLRTPVVFVHGAKDPFGSEQEMRAALLLIPVETELKILPGAGHDLGRDRKAAARTISAALREPGAAI